MLERFLTKARIRRPQPAATTGLRNAVLVVFLLAGDWRAGPWLSSAILSLGRRA
jgi:hypothetical protein